MKDLKKKVNKKTKKSRYVFSWFEKKGSIVGFSSIISIVLLGAALTASTLLMSNIYTTAPIIDNSKPLSPVLIDTFNLLNVENNKASRLKVWNQYMNDLTTTQPPSVPARNNEFNNIIMSDTFIDQFIGFLTNNLNIGATTSNGAISQANANQIKSILSNNINKPLFKISTSAQYNNLFKFSDANIVMFQFLDNNITSKINFSLSLPVANLDILYNDDGTVSIKTMPNNTQVKLTINKFDALSITTPTDIYFKSENIFKLPSTITNGLNNYLDGPTGIIKLEEQYRNTLINNFESIQTKINNDKTNAIGLSYWNAFVLNYATVNTNFIIADLAKAPETGGIYKFLMANAKGFFQPDSVQLHFITSLSGNVIMNQQPFIASPAYSNNSLFVTAKQSDPIYSLNLNITKFNFKFNVPNFFTNNPIITVNPILTFGGTLQKSSSVHGTVNYDISLADYDVSEMIDMSIATGFQGFFIDLINPEKTETPMTLFTNSLVNINGQNIDNQIKFWNDFNNNLTSRLAIMNELSKPNVLYNFIMSNIDSNNISGYGTFPSVDWEEIRASINEKAVSLNASSTNLQIVTGAYHEAIALENVKWGGRFEDKFASVKIYFGNESIPTINSFNVTSTIDGSVSNISLSQEVGPTDFANLGLDVVPVAGSQRISIVFRTWNEQAHVFYFGQKKLANGQQITTPIVIPNTILSKATNFANAIKTFK